MNAGSSAVTLTHDYEGWLAGQVTVLPADLAIKHAQMDAEPLVFLRATYYLWLARFGVLLPELSSAPPVVGVGDLHVENFGTWRDVDGRWCWGVNDLDEIGCWAYPNELVRLATSVLVAAHTIRLTSTQVCHALLEGWRQGLDHGGGAYVLDGSQHHHLRDLVPKPSNPQLYWRRLSALPHVEAGQVPRKAQRAVAEVAPTAGWPVRWHTRRAGEGSLGRRRYVAVGFIGDGEVAREVKELGPATATWPLLSSTWGAAVCPEAWTVMAAGPLPAPIGRGRRKGWQTRRLAPDVMRIEVADQPIRKEETRLLTAMGRALAVIHCSDPTRAEAARAHEADLPHGWLAKAADQMCAATHEDWARWKAR